MSITTMNGVPLSDTARKNLERFQKMVAERKAAEEAQEAHEARHQRAGVHVYTDEEKAAFLASRTDLVNG
jgi:5,10-methylenetetrahydrofolate reductase